MPMARRPWRASGMWRWNRAGPGAAAPHRLLYPVEANEVFLRMAAAEREALREQGFGFYDWELAGPEAARFVVRWDQEKAAIEALAAAIRQLG